jgi:hypothetical protein
MTIHKFTHFAEALSNIFVDCIMVGITGKTRKKQVM